jgi:hypothetical protein
VFQLVLPFHECVDPTATEPLHYVADSATEPLQSVADSATEPLQSVADSAAAGAALTETS